LIHSFVHLPQPIIKIQSIKKAYISTVGADYLKRDVVLRDGRPVRLQLWDIAGQDRFVHLTRAYFARGRGGGRKGGKEGYGYVSEG